MTVRSQFQLLNSDNFNHLGYKNSVMILFLFKIPILTKLTTKRVCEMEITRENFA